MFYRAQDGHPLPHNPFKAIVSPRPIAWISTRDGNGVDNLAPKATRELRPPSLAKT